MNSLKMAMGLGVVLLAGTAQARDRIEAVTAERYEAINQLDSERYSVEVLEKRVAKFMADNARLKAALTGIKKAAAHRMQNDRRDLHSYYFHTADAALTGKEPDNEVS